MKVNLTVPCNKIHNETRLELGSDEIEIYGGMFVGKYSYAVKLSIDNGVEYTFQEGRVIHNFHIGNYNSIGQNLQVVMGRNHSTKQIDTGAMQLYLQEYADIPEYTSTYVQKGSVIVQNDVWIGENVTIMPGVIVRNGAVIARNSHVVKDVPPYAIVGGNPAKVIGYRFTEEQIRMLQEIQWWNWDTAKAIENARYFTEDIDKFCEKFYPEAHQQWEVLGDKRTVEEHSYFAFLDYYDGYSSYPLIMESFINRYYDDSDKKLILFVQDDCEQPMINQLVYKYLQEEIQSLNEDSGILCQLELVRGTDEMAQKVFQRCAYYITSRTYRTAYYTCLADMLQMKIISGVDNPICYE